MNRVASTMDSGNLRDRAERASAALLDYITGHIERGDWAPGAKLPTERQLEQRFGLSRNTLRKSLKALEAAGRIVRAVGRGSFVAAPAAARSGLAAGADGLLARIQGASPAEVMEVRLMLEPLAGELAAIRAASHDLALMEDCLREADRAGPVADFEHWDGRLHLAIIGAARNSLLMDLYQAINAARTQPEWAKLKARSVTPERRRTYQAQHRAVVAALKDRDGDQARAALRAHLALVRAHLLGEG